MIPAFLASRIVSCGAVRACMTTISWCCEKTGTGIAIGFLPIAPVRSRQRSTMHMRALYRVAGRDPSRASATDFGFVLGPRINAAGRLGTANRREWWLLDAAQLARCP